MVLVSVLLFDSTPAWNKRRLLYVKLVSHYCSANFDNFYHFAQLFRFLTTFFTKTKIGQLSQKKPSPEHPVSARPKCQAQLVAYGRWSRSRVQT